MESSSLPFSVREERLENPKLRMCTIIGGRGFLGRSLLSRLLQLNEWIIRIADSDPSIVPDPNDPPLVDALSSGRASYHQLNKLDSSLILKDDIGLTLFSYKLFAAIGSSSIVFFVDFPSLQSHEFLELYKNVVEGTKNVIAACRECQVRQLIYISSADVVFDGSRDIINGDESLPFQIRHDDILMDLKAQAESIVLCSNNIDNLLTCVLRPSNVFGPRDPELVPILVKSAKLGLAKFIVGDGDNMLDFTYCENVSHAIICVVKALDSRMTSVAGKVFFITNLEPFPFWKFVSLMLEGLGYQRPTIKIPAAIIEYPLLISKWMQLDTSTSARLLHVATRSRTFTCSSAQKQIKYEPVVTMEDGIRTTIQSFLQSHENAAFCEVERQSKAEKLLGCGKVAEILLWRDETVTFMYFTVVFALFYLFFLSGRTFASSFAHLLFLAAFSLYGYGILTKSGTTFSEMSGSYFKVSENFVTGATMAFVNLWNKGVFVCRDLARGQNWSQFFKAALVLYCLKVFLAQSLKIVVGRAVVLAFTGFYVYEQYESEIDGFASFSVVAFGHCGVVLKNAAGSVAAGVSEWVKQRWNF